MGMATRRWVWWARGLGLVAVAAATAVIALAIQHEEPDRRTPREREAALLTAGEYPPGYEVDRLVDGVSPPTATAQDEYPPFDPATCGELLELGPRAKPGNGGVGALAGIPTSAGNLTTWTTTDYTQLIISAGEADWDAGHAARLVADCGTATAHDGEVGLTLTAQRLPLSDAVGPDSVAYTVAMAQDDGIGYHTAVAVERVAGQLVVLQAATFAEFDVAEFLELATAATHKVQAELG